MAYLCAGVGGGGDGGAGVVGVDVGSTTSSKRPVVRGLLVVVMTDEYGMSVFFRMVTSNHQPRHRYCTRSSTHRTTCAASASRDAGVYDSNILAYDNTCRIDGSGDSGDSILFAPGYGAPGHDSGSCDRAPRTQ